MVIHSCEREQVLLRWGKKTRARVAKVTAAEGRGDKPPGNQRAKKAKSQEYESFVLRKYIVGGMGVKKLHID